MALFSYINLNALPFLKSFYFYKKETPYFLKIKPIQIALFMIFLLGGLFGLMFLSQEGVIQNNRAPEDGFAVEGVSFSTEFG